MNRVSSDEMKEIEIEILKYIKRVCENNGLKYYLAYGTLIGAVRHNGFIPWDDDIDIIMPREDYKKLATIINSENNQKQFKLVSVDTENDFTAPLAKVIDTRTKLVQHYGFFEKVELGVYVDVFIVDGVPGDFEVGKKYYLEAYDIYQKWAKANLKLFPPGMKKSKSILLWIYSIPYKIKGYKYWLTKLEKHNSQYSFYDTEFVSVLEAGTKEPEKNVWPQRCFGNKGIVLFEGEEYAAPEDYDYLLKSEYGDYMQLPPLEKRISHHQYDAYWKEG